MESPSLQSFCWNQPPRRALSSQDFVGAFRLVQPCLGPILGRGCSVDPAVARLPRELNPHGRHLARPTPGLHREQWLLTTRPGWGFFAWGWGSEMGGTSSRMETAGPGGRKMAASSLPHQHP